MSFHMLRSHHLRLILASALWFLWQSPLEGQAPLRFEVTTQLPAASGRVFVVIAKDASEPRNSIGRTGVDAAPVLGRDIVNLGPGAVATLDRTAQIFPIASIDVLPAGDYFVQALFDTNRDLKSVNAPGNSYSEVQHVSLDPRRGGVVRLQLTKTIPPEQMPVDSEYVKYVRIQSQLLTRFHGRPIYLRAGVILPRDHSVDRNRRYPLRVHIGGYGARFTGVQRQMADGSEFRRMWLADETPRMIYLHLDGDGPLGDPYQVNSANHGPYGDAITRELIPHVEREYRGLAEPWARVLDGGSTGGWVSLALKVFYPDFFNATWSSCPDGVDFRAFQLVNIYSDRNAYVNAAGFERPSARNENGDVRFTMRHECQMENVMGAGDSWTMSGGQWGAWNATYGPRGHDDRPVPLWDPQTGAIDSKVAEYWKKYDLRLMLEENWKTLAPKMRGKINVWVGEADDYFLNNAVHMLGNFFEKANPAAEARVVYGPGEGHCWRGISEVQMMSEMAEVIERSRPRAQLWEEQRSGTGARLRGVSAVSRDVVWASGSGGTYVRTVDGGKTWSAGVVPGAGDLDFRDVHGVDANVAYLLSIGEGEKSRIYKTTDGGRSWNLQFTNRNPQAFFDGFAFWNPGAGVAFSDPVDGRFLVIRTGDGGASWNETPRENMPPALPGEAAFAASGTSIIVGENRRVWIGTGGSAARVFRSEDGGTTWSVAVTPIMSGGTSAGIFSLLLTGSELLAVGGDYQKEKESSANFARSVDGGRTWSLGPQLPGYRSAIGRAAGGANVDVAVGPSGSDYRRDGEWISIDNAGYHAVSFVEGFVAGWAVGEGGRIARFQFP